MATCIIICWSPSLVWRRGIRSIIIRNSPWIAETCVTPLLIWLHSNHTIKDVKELMAHIRKKCCKGSCCVNFIIVLKENVFIFNATFSRGWCISSSILRTFGKMNQNQHFSQNSQVKSFTLIQWHKNKFFHIVYTSGTGVQLFLHNPPFWKVWVQIAPTKHWWAKI